MESWHVWDVRPVSECLARAGKRPVDGRWVDDNKGDAETPNVKSRYLSLIHISEPTRLALI
eukprot:14903990-Alexandrium_andersonii.AAC.1